MLALTLGDFWADGALLYQTLRTEGGDPVRRQATAKQIDMWRTRCECHFRARLPELLPDLAAWIESGGSEEAGDAFRVRSLVVCDGLDPRRRRALDEAEVRDYYVVKAVGVGQDARFAWRLLAERRWLIPPRDSDFVWPLDPSAREAFDGRLLEMEQAQWRSRS
jgi:hypothetical protein